MRSQFPSRCGRLGYGSMGPGRACSGRDETPVLLSPHEGGCLFPFLFINKHTRVRAHTQQHSGDAYSWEVVGWLLLSSLLGVVVGDTWYPQHTRVHADQLFFFFAIFRFIPGC